MSEEGLLDLRNKLDNIDNKLLELINERMHIVHQVGALKAKSGGAIYRPEREKAIIDRLEKINSENNGLLNRSAIEALFLEIFAISRNIELPENKAYLGPEGSFTHQAAEGRFGAMSSYISVSSSDDNFLDANPTRQSLQALTCNSDTFTGKLPEYADKTAGILRSRKTNVLSL